MSLVLVRQAEVYGCTPGDFYLEGIRICRSIELPWLDNHISISCIPIGKYNLRMTYSNRFGKQTLQLLNVPGRSGIRIHSANLVSQLHGCIAPCVKYAVDNDVLFGYDSRIATELLEEVVWRENITELEIVYFKPEDTCHST